MKRTYCFDDLDAIAKEIILEDFPTKIFCFDGDLGAGKTTLIESICRILGSKDDLSSPTFSIINEYDIPNGVVYHMDWYRLQSEQEALHIGIEDYLYSGNYCFIEWYTKAVEIIPKPYVLIKILSIGDTEREINTEIVQ